MNASLPFLLPVFAFFCSVIVLFLILKTNLHQIALDQPNQRSLHQKPIPRLGGMGLLVSFCTVLVFLWQTPFVPLLFWGCLTLGAISFLDDLFNLSFLMRLAIHAVVAFFFIFALPADFSLPWKIFFVLATIWSMNLYNFMDGSDGLAGGMAFFGFGFYALQALSQHENTLFLVALSLSSAALGFLLFNFHPAKIFLGDSGSVPLGFLVSALGLWGMTQHTWSLFYPLFVFAPFILDATVTLFKRLLRGEKVWQAHKEHYYQRMIQLGYGHKKTALYAYILMFSSGIIGTYAVQKSFFIQGLLLAFVIILFGFLMRFIDQKWLQFQTPKQLSHVQL